MKPLVKQALLEPQRNSCALSIFTNSVASLLWWIDEDFYRAIITALNNAGAHGRLVDQSQVGVTLKIAFVDHFI